MQSFSFANIRSNSVIMIYGNIREGITCMIRDILTAKHASHYHIIDPDIEKHQDIYWDAQLAHSHYDNMFINAAIRDAKKKLQNGDIKGLWMVMDNPGDAINYDFQGGTPLTPFSGLRQLFMNGRCLRINTLIGLDRVVEMRDTFTFNVDYVILVVNYTKDFDIKAIYDMYIRNMMEYDAFTSAICDDGIYVIECLNAKTGKTTLYKLDFSM